MPQASIQEQIVALEGLAAVDAELAELEGQLATQRDTLSAKKQRLAELEERIARAEASIDEMDRLRGELIHEVRQMSLQVDKSREKMARCRTEREANAVQRELEELRKLYRDRELEVEKLAALVDQARSEVEGTAGQRQELLAELGSSEGALTQQLAELEGEIAKRNATRAGIAQKLPGQLARRYDMVRKRRGSGVASTTDGTCTGCHLAMPPQQFQLLMRRAQLDSCPHCSRIIYFKPPEADALDGDGVTEGA
jgi:predicted  nucleic acid-binding Zn-ribbon protein